MALSPIPELATHYKNRDRSQPFLLCINSTPCHLPAANIGPTALFSRAQGVTPPTSLTQDDSAPLRPTPLLPAAPLPHAAVIVLSRRQMMDGLMGKGLCPKEWVKTAANGRKAYGRKTLTTSPLELEEEIDQYAHYPEENHRRHQRSRVPGRCLWRMCDHRTSCFYYLIYLFIICKLFGLPLTHPWLVGSLILTPDFGYINHGYSTHNYVK
uniref:Uncharacterized protein n=1 Tax=Oryza brachyantha TaxID=4533 RepID=J3KU47_ORYBR